MEYGILLHISTYTLTHTFTLTHSYVLTPEACHQHIFKKSLVPHLNKHFLGPWSNNYGNNIQRPVMTGIISALFINKVICEVLPTGGRKNMLTCSNGIWPNGNDILTAAICNVGAPMSFQRKDCATLRQYNEKSNCPSSRKKKRQFDRITYHLETVHYFAELVVWQISQE